MIKLKIVVFPGSFDPFTVGHLDVVKRSLKLFDKVFILVMDNGEKNSLFTVEERVKIVNAALNGIGNVSVIPYKGLLVDACKELHADAIVKGVRNATDWTYEYDLYQINDSIGNGVETIFIPSAEKYRFISSTMVRELLKYKQDLKKYMPGRSAGVALKLYTTKYGGK